MSSTFIPQPKEFWGEDQYGDPKVTMNFLQFVPGVVVSVICSEMSVEMASDYGKLNSIIAMPHYTDNGGVRKASMIGEEGRHFPLLRH